MKYIVLFMNGSAYEITRESYEAFDRDKDKQEMLFHNFRDTKGNIHTVAKMGILSVLFESGVKLPSIQL